MIVVGLLYSACDSETTPNHIEESKPDATISRDAAAPGDSTIFDAFDGTVQSGDTQPSDDDDAGEDELNTEETESETRESDSQEHESQENDTHEHDAVFPESVPIPDRGPKLVSGSGGTCLVRDGKATCWGCAEGHGRVPGENCPTTPYVLSIDGYVSDVALGSNGGCALLDDGQVYCWGSNYYGQLGLDSPDEGFPTLSGYLTGVTQIALGVEIAITKFRCSLLADGRVACSGLCDCGQLGPRTMLDDMCDYGWYDEVPCSHQPIIVNTMSNAVQIAAGTDYACALKDDGTVWCWGTDSSDILGSDHEFTVCKRCGGMQYGIPCSHLPIQVGTLADISQLAAGSSHMCALKKNGSVWCWGYNGSGQIGQEPTVDPDLPIVTLPVTEPYEIPSLHDVKQIAAKDSSSCALINDGSVWCWGSNFFGNLGMTDSFGSPISDDDSHHIPVKVDDVRNVVHMDTGGDFACALQTDGDVYCWGNNSYGALGRPETGVMMIFGPSRVEGL